MQWQTALGKTSLLEGLAQEKHRLNNEYLMELDDENLLRNYRLEAGLIPFEIAFKPGMFMGWEIPSCQLRGHIAGHWLSAAARTYAVDGDVRYQARASYIVDEIARCQEENGNGWCFSIPEKYLLRIRDGKYVWAPQYTCHKTLMGLVDAYRYAGIERALDVLKGAARWFRRYTDDISREHMDRIMENSETGGMMEIWADLYGFTGEAEHLELMRRYERPLYYQKLLGDQDPLAGWHANTTIPEMLGVCRAYEVTGEKRYWDIAKAYWRWATEKRGMFATGGQTCYEAWTMPHDLTHGLAQNTQEHCTVYNMMRMAAFFLRHEGGAAYADYWERCLYNGVFAQGHYRPFYRHDQDSRDYNDYGLISYYLPLRQGSKLYWGSKKNDFWCCHGTLMQANSSLVHENVYFLAPKRIAVMQYLPSALALQGDEIGLTSSVALRMQCDTKKGYADTNAVYLNLSIQGGGQTFALQLRVPSWIHGEMNICINGVPAECRSEDGFICIERCWDNDELTISLPKQIRRIALEGQPHTYALCDGPVVLAGLTAVSRRIKGEAEACMVPLRDRVDGMWSAYWHTVNQEEQMVFTPLFNVGRETYTVYFDFDSDT